MLEKIIACVRVLFIHNQDQDAFSLLLIFTSLKELFQSLEELFPRWCDGGGEGHQAWVVQRFRSDFMKVGKDR